ncbi:MAG: ribosome maturation factor RimM [Spirochaetia bacterium]|nr:ribosome maturation factor RimM [Spirochaetota bacterium]MCX8096466.1 ribosome maturation factor RimM [Spirochaetota bacterium]MDW8112730.1 ribosome maturation factor RimM [Spirochaetia bacterium]
MEERYVEVGRILGRFKLENQVKVEPLLDTIEEMLRISEYYLKTMTGYKRIKLKVDFVGSNYVVYYVEDFNPQLVDHLKGKIIFTPYQNLPKLREDQFYIADLEGSTIYESDGKEIGTLKRVLTDGKNYFLEFLDYIIPLSSRYVRKVDIRSKSIILTEVFSNEKEYLK